MADGSRRFRVTCSAMILASVLATACGSETPQPGNPTSTEAVSIAFTSELYGFELVLPSL